MIYQWKNGFCPKGVRPDGAAQQIERLRVFHKTLTVDLIVEDSKRPEAALNPYFEWNNQQAAYQWRLEQARRALRSLVVIHDSGNGETTQPIRAYVHIIDEDEREDQVTHEVTVVRPNTLTKGRYERIDVAMADQKSREYVLQRAWREVTSWRDRYKEYQEFSRICSVIDEVSEQIAS